MPTLVLRLGPLCGVLLALAPGAAGAAAPGYAWLRGAAPAPGLERRVAPPPGYAREAVAPGSFAAWLRGLPLRPGTPPVRLHDGRLKRNQSAHAAVFDLDVGPRDLQQCADAVIRLRAEHLWASGQAEAVTFRFASGAPAAWSEWRQGARPVTRRDLRRFREEPRLLTDWPCAGCVTRLPAGHDAGRPAPLLVVLHGDGAPARDFARSWFAAASGAGHVLFAPQCPASEGCSGSWWRWGGDPAWLVRQVEAVAAGVSVDRARIYLAGWSGGATWAGMYLQALAPRFAALGFVGGGHPPIASTECAPRPVPAYFLLGARDAMARYAAPGRDFARGCGHETVWELAPRVSHADGIVALQRRLPALIAWLGARRG